MVYISSIFALAILLAFSVCNIFPFIYLENYTCYKNLVNKESKFYFLQKNIIRFTILTVMCILNIIFPKLEETIRLAGNVSRSSLTFRFPVLLYNKIFHDKSTKIMLFLNYFLLTFGVIASILGTLAVYVKLMNKWNYIEIIKIIKRFICFNIIL